ncbi:MAG: lysostaphin resistance A-like protein [Actinomycetota bacterium]
MTTIDVPTRARTSLVPAAFAVVGCMTLAMRPVSATSVVPTALVGIAGIAMPAARAQPSVRAHAPSRARWSSRARWLGVTIAGSAAFGVARLAVHAAPVRVTAGGLAAVAIASIAEEAFFRRAIYALLVERSVALAIAVTALVFAAIHVPVYGVRVLPLDITAGVLLGWQRYATDTWTSCAVTHLFANLIQMR